MHSFNATLTIIRPNGALNAANAHLLQAQLSETIRTEQSGGLMVDMSQVESLDSAGLVSLISVLRLARDLSKRFCLCSVPPSIRMVFELTQLDRVFELVEETPAQVA